MAAKCWPYLNSLNVHNFPIFEPILMIFVSKFMVHRVLSDKINYSLGLLSSRAFPENSTRTQGKLREFRASKHSGQSQMGSLEHTVSTCGQQRL